MAARIPLLFAAVVVVALSGGGAVLTFGRQGEGTTHAVHKLTSEDFGQLRREALDLFPRGSPIHDASAGLTGLGFRCAPARHMMANINAPSVECDSAGRGYPTASRIQITVMARNGMVSDIAVGNGFDPFQADARTPSPHPKGQGATMEN